MWAAREMTLLLADVCGGLGVLSRAPMATQSLGMAQSENNLVCEPNVLLELLEGADPSFGELEACMIF